MQEQSTRINNKQYIPNIKNGQDITKYQELL